MPGPPFAFGAILVILALLVAIFIPEAPPKPSAQRSPTRRTSPTDLEMFQRDTGRTAFDEECQVIICCVSMMRNS